MKEQTTWSPTCTRVTPGPTASTIPAPSWPPTTGKRIIASPLWMWSSEWHSPAAMNLMRTSLGRGSSSSSSVISHGLPGSRQTAARVVMLIGTPFLDRTSAPVYGRRTGALALAPPSVPDGGVGHRSSPRRKTTGRPAVPAVPHVAHRSDLAFRDAESAVLPFLRHCRYSLRLDGTSDVGGTPPGGRRRDHE